MKQTLYLVINSLHGGGAERVASRLSSVWSKDYNLKVISLMPFTDNDYLFCGEKVSVYDYYKGLTWIGKIKSASKRIDELAIVDKPIAIIAFLQNANLCVSYTKYKTKKILSIRNYLDKQYTGVKKFIWTVLVKNQFVKADYVVSVSKLINQEMHSKYGISSKKCACIYNPYDIDSISVLKVEELSQEETLFFDNHKVLCNVGHLSAQKGQYHLIRILPELLKHDPSYRVAIIGKDNSSYASKLKELSLAYGVKDNVLFTGITSNPYKYISRSHCFVFTSLYEGFPNALVEAMVCGVPVISTDCPSGPSEILGNNKYGYLEKYDDSVWRDISEPLTSSEKSIIQDIIKLEDSDIYSHFKNAAIERSSMFTLQEIALEWVKLID